MGGRAIPPPGTRPPLVGLAVPEDFALPEGYVRHHQATDDGQRIEAILMFSPDRQFVLGRPGGDERIVIAGGDRGHGFKHAPASGELPKASAIQGQLEQQRVNLRAQGKLRDLRRDAVIEYR